jgi:hypothetical protein
VPSVVDASLAPNPVRSCRAPTSSAPTWDPPGRSAGGDGGGAAAPTRLVRAIGHGIRERGETPLLHAATNLNAIRLYQSLGFTLRQRAQFYGLRTPSDPSWAQSGR